MYLHRLRFATALGKTAEAKRLITDHVKHLQSQGQRLTLSEAIFSSDGPMLIVTHVAAELADIERVRHSRLTDHDFQTRSSQVLATLSEPPRSSLYESIVDLPPNPPPSTISQLAFAYPAIGRDRELVVLMSEFVGQLQKMGQQVSLWRRIYSSDGSVIQFLGRHADLADLDRARQARTDLAARTTAAMAEFSRAPLQHRLTETVVPLPPA